MSLQDQRDTVTRQVDDQMGSGNIVAAISTLKAALKADPHFFQGWLRLSRILFETENYPEAVQVGQAAEQFDPLQADFRAIQSHMQAQAFGQAEQVAKQMLLKQPGHPRAVFTLAHVAGLKNYPEGQVAALQHGIELSPANLVLRSRLVAASWLASPSSSFPSASRPSASVGSCSHAPAPSTTSRASSPASSSRPASRSAGNQSG